MDPLTHVYDDLLQTLRNQGYVDNQELYSAVYDWRMAPGPVGLPGVTSQSITAGYVNPANSNSWAYGVNYFGYWLATAQDNFEKLYGIPLDNVDVIAHSTGSLVVRAYMQSGAYGGQYVDPQLGGASLNLPTIENFVMMAVPNQGAPKAWNPLQNNFSSDPAYYLVLSKIIDLEFNLVQTFGLDITSPDESSGAITASETGGSFTSFINLYCPTITDLLATYPFLDLNPGNEADGSGVLTAADPRVVNSATNEILSNEFLSTLNGTDPVAYTGLAENVTDIFGTGVNTPTSVIKFIGPQLSPAPGGETTSLYPMSAVTPQTPLPGESWYEDIWSTAGDGTVPVASSVGPLAPLTNVNLFPIQGATHTGIMSDPSAQNDVLMEVDGGGNGGPIDTASTISNSLGAVTTALLFDPVQGYITNAEGQRLGYTNATGPLAEIPGSLYIGGTTGIGFIFGQVSAPLTLNLIGVGQPYSAEAAVDEPDAVGGVQETGALADNATETIPIPLGGATTTTLSKNTTAPIVFGQSVVFTATLAVASPGAGTPTGSITFMDGTTAIGTGTVSEGVATLTTNALPVASNSLKAVYSGDTNFTTSTSGFVTQTVTKSATTTTLTKNTTAPIQFGQSVTFRATLAVVSPGTGVPTGTVTFEYGTTVIGTGTLSDGVATLATAKFPVGTNLIKAVYGGNADFTGNTSDLLIQTVTNAASATVLTKNTTAPIEFGQSVTFTATLGAVSPGSGVPTGTVAFEDGTTVIGTATLSRGIATFATGKLPVASDSIKAVYGGDADFTASTSASLTQTVTRAASATVLTKNATAPIEFGRSVTFTATLAAVSPRSGVPTGTVTFEDGATAIGTATLSHGVATLATGKLPVASNLIKAVYNGDTDFTASDSASLTQTVIKSAATTTLTKDTTAAIRFGQCVRFTATVAPASPGAGVPTGIVTFEDGTTILGTGTLSDGVAMLTTMALPVGSDSITAVFDGDADFATSISDSLTQAVTAGSCL